MPSDVELLGSDSAPADSGAEPEVISSDTPTPESTVDADALTTPEGTEPVTEPVVAEPVAEEEDLDLMPAAAEDPLSVKALNEKITKSPEFQAALAKDPGLRNLLYATARQAHQAQEYKQIFPTPATAKTALDLANRHIEFENTVRQNPTGALEAFYGLTASRDEQGNILWDQPNPEYQAAMTTWRETNLWAPALQQAEGMGDKPLTLPNGQVISAEDLRDALAISAVFFGDKVQSGSPYVKAGAQAPGSPKLDPETESRLARLDKLEQGQREQQAQQAQQYQSHIVQGIGDGVTKAAKSYLDNLVKNNSSVVLTDYIKAVVIDKAVQDIYNLARTDTSYQNHINFIYKSTSRKDAALQEKLVSEAVKYGRERLPKLIAKHISEASKGVVATQQQKLQKQTSQKQRTEVQGTAGVTSPSRQDPAERVREFIQKNKRKPTDLEMLSL